jgi:hypothetical protein
MRQFDMLEVGEVNDVSRRGRRHPWADVALLLQLRFLLAWAWAPLALADSSKATVW